MVNAEETNSGRLGILFTGGDGPSPDWLRTLLSQDRDMQTDRCLQTDPESPLLVAADSGLLLAERAGLLPHWIIGDMDSLDAESLADYPPERVLRYPHDKDYTDTEMAFNLLREKGCGPVWIIGGGGGRLDHLFGIRALFEREYPPERWITALEDIRCLCASVTAAAKAFSEKWNICRAYTVLHFLRKPPSMFRARLLGVCEEKKVIPSSLEVSSTHAIDPVSVFPLGDGPWEAESSGLVWPLAGLDWKRGFFGLSNRAPSGAFTVTAKRGRFFVMTPLE